MTTREHYSFTSPDEPFAGQVAADPQTWNLYTYTSNNPLNRIDPDGQRWFYKKDKKGRITEVQWVNPNDDGTYTSPGEGWIEFVPSQYQKTLWVYTDGGTVVYMFGETAEGAPTVHANSTGMIQDHTIEIVVNILGVDIPARLGVKALVNAVSEAWAQYIARRSASMLGSRGAQFTSRTVWKRGSQRIDVENPAPGQRPGQIHFQDSRTKEKYLYDPKNQKFIGAPNSVNQKLKDPQVKAAIDKALKLYLGESR